MDAVLQWLSTALALLPAGLIAGVGIGAGGEAVKWLKESSQRRREQRDVARPPHWSWYLCSRSSRASVTASARSHGITGPTTSRSCRPSRTT
jgi:hypothetical protein